MTVGWNELLPGVLWECEVDGHVSGFPLRSTAVALSDGSLCVMSPTRAIDPASPTSLGREVRVLFAPNHFHYLGVPTWKVAHPDAHVVAGDVAKKRLEGKLSPLALGEAAMLRERLPASITWLEPEGTRNGEVWLEISHGDQIAWLVCDAFFNVPASPKGFMGWALRAIETVPGLKLGTTWKYLALADRGRYKGWLLERLATKPPTMLVFSHGDTLVDEQLGQRLASIVEERL
ncbi:MAG: hypothetical protein HOW73_08750 [Polyangiaceae bacterium]|nr:hypothetical protein [Polyangiaceae bacterium]